MSPNKPIDPSVPSLMGDNELQQIKTQLTNLDHAQRHIDQAVRGGINMDHEQKQLNESRDKLMKLKQSYFPGH